MFEMCETSQKTEAFVVGKLHQVKTQSRMDAVFSTQKYKHITLRGGMLSCNPSQHLPMQCLSERLSHLGLKPLDVGGSGDCFFKAVSHQLYQTPALCTYHWLPRGSTPGTPPGFCFQDQTKAH